MGGEKFQIMQQQIAEIARVQQFQTVLILAVQFQRLAVCDIADISGADFVGRQPTVLEPFDDAVNHAGRPALVVDIGVRHELFYQADLVVRVQDGEIRFEPDQLRMASQNSRGQGVKRADPQPVDRIADQARDPLAHFPRRPVGEGHGEDLPRPGAPGDQDIGQPRRTHAGLAGARAGQHQKRPLGGFHGFPLHIV